MSSIERARQSSAEMSMALEGGSKARQTAPKIDDVDEMSKFVGDQLANSIRKPRVIGDGHFPLTHVELAKKLRHYKQHLLNFMLQVPRNKGEEIDAYRSRLSLNSRDSTRLSHVLDMIANIEATFAIKAREEAAARNRKDEEYERDRRKARAELERNASPDPKVIKELESRIDAAHDAEAYLADIMKAISKHLDAEQARRALREMYERQRNACGPYGLNKPCPPQRPVHDASAGVCEFTQAILRRR